LIQPSPNLEVGEKVKTDYGEDLLACFQFMECHFLASSMGALTSSAIFCFPLFKGFTISFAKRHLLDVCARFNMADADCFSRRVLSHTLSTGFPSGFRFIQLLTSARRTARLTVMPAGPCIRPTDGVNTFRMIDHL